MKAFFVTATAAVFLIGTGVALAESAGGNGPKGTVGKTAQKMQRHHVHRYTSGANIRDPGSTSNLPGKDGLTSKAWIENK